MNQSKKHIAIKSLLIGSLMLALTPAIGQQPVASVLLTSGVLLKKAADGGVKVLKPRSTVAVGDTLITQAKSYAQLRLSDELRVILQPGTTFTVESVENNETDSSPGAINVNLKQGSVRVTTALSAKGGKRQLVVNTPAGAVDMDNGSAVIQYLPESAQAAAARRDWLLASSAALDTIAVSDAGRAGPSMAIRPLQLAQNASGSGTNGLSPALGPGLYVHVIDGIINVTNKGGTMNFSAGQFGYTPSFKQPPVVLPVNPGLKFTPPTTFSSAITSPSGNSSSKATSVDCEVR